MSNTEKLHEFAVLVAGGSGCLFQPETTEYTYVLTAKHIIEDSDSVTVTRQLKDEARDQTLKIIGKPFFLENADNDAAIIKIEFVNGLSPIHRIDYPYNNDLDIFLVGHPSNRRERQQSSYRADSISQVYSKPDKYLEGVITPVPIQDEVEGKSGGGIIAVEDNKHYLAGIQKGMSVEKGSETLGRIDFMPLSFFDEIIEKFSGDLLPLPRPSSDKDQTESRENDSPVVERYRQWLKKINETFSVPVLDLRMPIESAWDEVFLHDGSSSSAEMRDVAEEINRYHEWERLAQDARRQSKTYSATNLTISEKHFVVTAGPGAGKSTLAKRLAAHLTEQGKTVLLVSLKLVARLLRDGLTFQQALEQVALASSGIPAAIARDVFAAPHFLIADGLDECDPDRAAIANHLIVWSHGHPDCRIWVTTRPVGHARNLLPGFVHAELLSLDDDAIRKYAEQIIQKRISDPQRQAALTNNFINLISGRDEKKQIASIAARNPLLLSFLLALFLQSKPLSGKRAALFGQIFKLMQDSSLSERVVTVNVSSVVAERVAEVSAWQMVSNPAIDKRTLVERLTQDLQNQTGKTVLQSQQLAEDALLFWEERQLIERLRIADFETYTFVHLSLTEYLAGRFIARMGDAELALLIEKERNNSRFRQSLLLACGVGAADRVVNNLLEWDEPENPVSVEAVTAAFAVNEAETAHDDLVARVIEQLRKRLTSDIPLIAVEAGEGLRLLAAFVPRFVAEATKDLLEHEQKWTRLAAYSARIAAGREFVTLDETTRWLDDLKFVRRFFYTQEAAENKIPDLPGEAFELQEDAFVESVEKILAETEREAGARQVKSYIKKLRKNFTLGLMQKIGQVLGRHDLAEALSDVFEESDKDFHVHLVRNADDVTRDKSETDKPPEVAILESVIIAAGGSPAANSNSYPTGVNPRQPNQLLILTSGLKLVHTPVTGYYALSDTNKIGGFQEVLRAAIAALNLDRKVIRDEAQALLALLQSDNQVKLWEVISEVPVEIDWKKAKSADLDIARLVEALDHSAEIVKVPAALILLTGTGGNEALPLIEQIFRSTTQNSTLRVISYVIPRLWQADDAVRLLIERLRMTFSPGFQYIYQALGDLWSKVNDDLQKQIIVAILSGFESEDPFAARGAAEALLDFRITGSPFVNASLKNAFQYWTTNNDETRQNPRHLILKNLTRAGALSLEELIGLSEDLDHDVSKTAHDAIRAMASESNELLEALLGKIQDGLHPFKSSTALNLFNSLLKLPSEQLRAAESTLLDLEKYKIAAIRSRIISMLPTDWISVETALATAQMGLKDSSAGVRSTAVKTIRLLNAASRIN